MLSEDQPEKSEYDEEKKALEDEKKNLDKEYEVAFGLVKEEVISALDLC